MVRCGKEPGSYENSWKKRRIAGLPGARRAVFVNDNVETSAQNADGVHVGQSFDMRQTSCHAVYQFMSRRKHSVAGVLSVPLLGVHPPHQGRLMISYDTPKGSSARR